MEPIRRSKSRALVRKKLGCFFFASGINTIALLLVSALGVATPSAVAATELATESAPSIEGRISDEINRLIPQIDSVVRENVEANTATVSPIDETTALKKASEVTTKPQSKHFRPLYRRLHGSPGLRVEWINDPVSPVAPQPAKSDVPEYQALAMAGNSRAMTLLGLMYHQGAGGLKQDYGLAYEWYLKAMDKDDGDAIDSLAVLYRDGLGVKKAPKIAYLIFLSVYKWQIGSKEAQERAALNIQKLVEELPKAEIHEALSYTWDYVGQIVKSRGLDWEVSPSVLPNSKRLRIRDNDWWSESERAAMTFESPAPWDKVKAD